MIDGLTNEEEADEYGTDPLAEDTTGNGLCDHTEVKEEIERYVKDFWDKGHKYYTVEEFEEKHPDDEPDHVFTFNTHPLNPDTDFSGLNDSIDPIPKDYDITGDGKINHVDLIDPGSAYYVERLFWAVKNDPHLERDDDGNPIGSDDMSGDGVPNDQADDMSRDGMPTEYEKEYGVANGGWQNPYLQNERYGILLASGDEDDDENHPAFWNDIEYLYDVLLNDYDYLIDNIHLLYSVWDEDQDHSDGHPGVDDEASDKGLERAIENVTRRISHTDFLVIALRGHGGEDTMMLAPRAGDPPCQPTSILYRYDLARWLDVVYDMSYGRMAVMIGSCGSGGAIPRLQDENRIIMTSAKSDEDSYTTIESDRETGAFFYEGICARFPLSDIHYPGVVKSLGDMSEPFSLRHAFNKGRQACENNYQTIFGKIVLDGRSNPQISNEQLASSTYL